MTEQTQHHGYSETVFALEDEHDSGLYPKQPLILVRGQEGLDLLDRLAHQIPQRVFPKDAHCLERMTRPNHGRSPWAESGPPGYGQR